MPESNEQNLIVIEAFLEAAKRYARGGYDVIVDGIVGPWFLEPWLNICCLPHFTDYTDRMKEQAGFFTGKTGPVADLREVLAG